MLHFPVPGRAEIIAHRGYSARAPENTLVAIERAISAGADAVEFDVHVTSDGTPVLLHDDTLQRTTDGRGRVDERTFAELEPLDAGGWFGAEFRGEPIPSLEHVLRAIGDRLGAIYAEVKGFRGPEDLARITRVVREAGVADRTVLISMDWDALDRIRSADATLRIGYIVDRARQVDEAIRRTTDDPLALIDFKASIPLGDPPLADRIRSLSTEMAVWTVDDPEDASRLVDMGIPRITTNRVGTMVAWKRAEAGGRGALKPPR